ncbi:MAG: hypothetical protein ABR936_11845 [Bacteroidota bacterium]|jgi:hypothetical protein
MNNEILIPRATAKGRQQDTNCNIGIYGDHGGGKTAWVEEILLAQKKRLIIFDTLCKDYGNAEFCKATDVQYDAVVSDAMEFKTKLIKLLGADGKGGFRLVCRCSQDEQLDIMNTLFRYNNVKKRSTLTDTTFAVEEVTFYQSSNYLEPILRDHCQYGRHNRNNMIGIARIPKETNPLFRSQLDYVISFVQTEKRAIDFFAEYNPEIAERLKTLERGEFEIIKGKEEELARFITAP